MAECITSSCSSVSVSDQFSCYLTLPGAWCTFLGGVRKSQFFRVLPGGSSERYSDLTRAQLGWHSEEPGSVWKSHQVSLTRTGSSKCHPKKVALGTAKLVALRRARDSELN